MIRSVEGKSISEIQEMCKSLKLLHDGMIEEIKNSGQTSGNVERDAIKMAQRVTENIQSFMQDHRYFSSTKQV